jgi:tetratricopeptide (TPR) repeat protein
MARFLTVLALVLLSPSLLLAAPPEAVSLFGEPLASPPLSEAVRTERERLLSEAKAALDRTPGDADALLWVGRRTAYLGRYREAIEIFTTGVKKHPGDARFLRHRGHRWITLREFDRAVADLEQAAALVAYLPDESEPDGLPNARNLPTSTLKSNIWYHLGLARYLEGDFERALAAYRECLKVSTNPDMLAATTYWLHMTLLRLPRPDEARSVLAPVHAGLAVVENQAYLRMLLLFRGERSAEEVERLAQEELDPATLGYGLGNWDFVNGRRAAAIERWRKVVAAGPWPAFGAVAAEADLERLGEKPR